jgi:FkbM family methyltransferase
MPPTNPIDQQFQNIHRLLSTLNVRGLLLNQRLAALEAREKLRDLGRIPAMPVEFRAQFGEDALLWDLLGGQTEGFFIEVGAFDGYHYSVTYALEAVGWTGLLIEAIPERAEQCRQRRPRSRVVHAALSKHGSTGTVAFHVADDQYGGMLSYLHDDKDHLRDLDAGRIARRPVTVPLTTMNDLLKDHRGPIDVASIDVEGGELALLDGFDLHRFKPRVLLLEDNTYGANPALANYMQTQPYTQIAWLEMNRVYVRADETDIIRRHRRF